MYVLFPSDPLMPRQVEPDFQAQAEASQEVGFIVLRVDHDALTRGDVERALRFVAASEQPQAVVYRGWMLRADAYAGLYDGLMQRGFQLINTPSAYANCHQIPGWYEVLEDVTPRSVWIELGENERTPETLPRPRIWEAIASFGDVPLVLKDWVKSRKHEWHEACFIPSASDRSAVERVTRRFVGGQAESLVGGLVYREWLPFQAEGTDPRGLPRIMEERWWVMNTAPFLVTLQTDITHESRAPRRLIMDWAERVHAQFGSHFFTMDVAQLPDGTWRVIEIGDGQVSGLPSTTDVDEPRFYNALGGGISGTFPWLSGNFPGLTEGGPNFQPSGDLFSDIHKKPYNEAFDEWMLPSSGDS